MVPLRSLSCSWTFECWEIGLAKGAFAGRSYHYPAAYAGSIWAYRFVRDSCRIQYPRAPGRYTRVFFSMCGLREELPRAQNVLRVMCYIMIHCPNSCEQRICRFERRAEPSTAAAAAVTVSCCPSGVDEVVHCPAGVSVQWQQTKPTGRHSERNNITTPTR